MKRLKSIVALLMFLVGLGVGSVEAATTVEETEVTTPEWIEVNLEVAGSLGVQILYQVDMLSDVKYLRVSGPMNANDWTTIKNCNNLVAIDLENTTAVSIPASQFANKSKVRSVILPKNIETIGSEAFKSSGIYEIVFPASLKTLEGTGHFNNSYITKVTFSPGCGVTIVPDNMFRNCASLVSVELSEGIKTIGSYAFYNCSQLSSINLPSALRNINYEAFSSTTALKEIVFPDNLYSIAEYAFYHSGLTAVNLPIGLTSLGDNAFNYCHSVKELRLPVGIGAYRSCFGSMSPTKITCYCAVPPIFTNNDNFSVDSADLIVPDFAIADYKLDSFWHNAKTITGGAAVDMWKVLGGKTLSMTDNRRFDGKPTVTVSAGSNFIVGGMAAMPLQELGLYNDLSVSSYAQFLNSCPAISAETIWVSNYLSANSWYFFTVPFDVKLSEIYDPTSSASFVIRYYDGENRAINGTGGSWKSVEDDGVLVAGKGYIMQSNKEARFIFPAVGEKFELFDPNVRKIELEANASEKAADAGWNLIGNPWSCYYDLYYSMLTCPITVWDRNNKKYIAYSMIDDNVVLTPYQAFFVQASDELSEIEFTTSGRQLTQTIERAQKSKDLDASSSRRFIFNLAVSTAEYSDETRVVLNEESSLGYESNRDASKFFSDDPTIPMLYTLDDEGTPLAINERPDGDGIVKLGFYAPGAGHFTIRNMRADGALSLEDKYEGKTMNLATGEEYGFEVAEGGHVTDRFLLSLSSPVPSSVEDVTLDSAMETVTVDGNDIVISGNPAWVKVYTVDGKLIKDKEGASITRFTLPKGLYIIQTSSKSHKLTIE
ncbi:MAG: leucine-rich repeat domain-containing protein [Muribaculaceae bacterium]|nr:leucine-rich repeat domain-containing protein [Muribaculaceae bacterium]